MRGREGRGLWSRRASVRQPRAWRCPSDGAAAGLPPRAFRPRRPVAPGGRRRRQRWAVLWMPLVLAIAWPRLAPQGRAWGLVPDTSRREVLRRPLPTPLGSLALPPVPVVRGFGWSERLGRPWLETDVRLGLPPGAPAVAAAAGTVWSVGDDPGRYGLYVVLDHGSGWATLYGDCARVLVRPGQRVWRGQALCVLGATGPPGPGALIFALWLDGQPLDPQPYLAVAAGGD